MSIQTFSIVAGSEACNARCPYCISRMTPDCGMTVRLPDVNWRNFEVGCRYARNNGVNTVLITGKGEPTLFPGQLTDFLRRVHAHGFPLVELQTNGVAIAERHPVTDGHLQEWYDLGLTLVAISVVHWEAEVNRRIFRPEKPYYDLSALVDDLHRRGFAVRLACTMHRGGVDSYEAVVSMADFCRRLGVEQLKLCPVTHPEESADASVADWVEAHELPAGAIDSMRERLDAAGHRLIELVHGAIVYDLDGQNICLSNCLTIDPANDRLRQLIFFPDGHLRHDWQYRGAILI